MKKIKYFLFITTTVLLTNCGDKFLEQKDLYDQVDANYYKTPAQISAALAATYTELPAAGGVSNLTFLSNLLSDDCFGGGGSGDLLFHDCDLFTNSQEDNYIDIWREYYRGINRANTIIKNFKNAVYTNTVDQNQDLGEAYFLRSYFYFSLARLFGTVPLVLAPGTANLPKASADDLFAQIASDMQTAINDMTATPFPSIPVARLGHATKWAAEGMMARIFLFYTGYYNKTSLPLIDGGSISKDQVISWVDDCVANSGHALVSDFRNLWPYAYQALASQYPYNQKNNLNWVGEQGANTETVFAIKYSVYGGWNAPNRVSYSNQIDLYMGLRIQTNLIPWSLGWGGGPVNPQLEESFETGDIRLKGSIIDVNDPDEFGSASTKYVWNSSQCMNETGLWNKKYTSIQFNNAKNAIVGMYLNIYPSITANGQLWNLQDEVLVRFSDILLMGAELGGTNAQSYLDRVRTRVGLPSVPVTLDNIKRERRNELAFEGVRYWDLLRWHDAETAFAKVANISVQDQGVASSYTCNYRPETGGFLPIPESQIRVCAGVLKQNPGW